jgi:NAD(P)-dependent dehydrogenase (short-subunit alcohol dehydrogenase family)
VKSIRSCGITSGEVSCFQLDVGSFKSIKTFAGLVLKCFPRVDLLINNGMYVLLFYLLISLLTDDPSEI